ncbi:MAG: glycerophosphodiester phosphodiesterase, partial [Ignavibacteriales bacterium]|nr:glycerophosphodiester phosphodiesterase [Ignavibacteriales bacterium]
RQVLQAAHGKCSVNIELKGDMFLRDPMPFVRKVVEDVRVCGMESQVLLSSFTSDLLAAAAATEPSIPRGVIYNLYRDFGRPPSKLAGRVRASVFVCARRELRKSMIRDARQHSLALYVYTLNSVQDAQKMVEQGVDGIISDNADDIVRSL